jgi:hypothetical protein
MDVEAQNTLLALLVVIIALLGAQTFALIGFLFAFRAFSRRMDALLNSVEGAARNAEPVLQAARELLVDSRENLNLISKNIVEISQLAKNQVTRLDGLTAEVSERLRVQVVRVDQLVSNTVTRVEETTEAVQRNILAPVREISAILVGVRTGLEFLLRRNKTRMERATQEEELFI